MHSKETCARHDRAVRAAAANKRGVPAVCLSGLLAFTLLAAPSLGPAAAAQRRPPAAEPTPPKPARPVTTGAFTDRTGAAHRWQIAETKTLIWDGQPYLPVGGTFAPRSFASDTDAAWQEDVAALSTLKSKGLQDILLWPGKPLPDVPLQALQRLVDYLDANGFRYGLAFGPGLSAPLTGTVVKPAAYRFADKDSVSATWQVPHADTALLILTDADDDNKILQGRSGQVTVRDGVVSVPIDAPEAAGKVVAILYPHKAIPAGDGELPDLWAGFDDYRDRVLTYLGQVKFGGGLRFFLDPLARHLGLLNESDYLVPDSPNFLLEWEGYLTRKYPNVDDLKLAWAINEGDFKTLRDLARLVPLWANGRGVPYFYDPAAHRPYRILDAEQSRWWQDFLQYRNEAILYYLNTMANVLKKQVADVPVVVTWTHSHPIFCNTDPQGGFDGLGIAARAHGAALVSRVVAPAYSEAEQAARTMWCVATEIVGAAEPTPQPAVNPQPTTAALPPGQPASSGGYTSRASLFDDLNWLRTVGIKGFFADGLQTNPEEAAGGAMEWLRHPDSLDWLKDYAARVAPAADYAPRILFFPQSAPGPARIGPVPGAPNVLWMDSFYPGEELDWWPSYSGYILQKGEGEMETALVSLQGKRETHLWCPDARQVRAFAPDGTPVPVKVEGKSVVVVTLDETPVLFQTGGQRLVPQEAAADAIIELNALLATARAQKIPAAETEAFSLDRAQYAYRTQKDFETAYTFARASLEKLLQDVKPYIWLEGETRYSTFTEIAPNAAASGGGYLRLSTPNPPGRLPYGAFYLFDVPADGRYNFWLAGTPPGPSTSPIQWRINQEPAQEVADPTPRGPLYLNDRFGWFLLGTANLKKGERQRLTIYVTDRAASPPNYAFSIDALLITPRDFVPNGRVRPLPLDTKTIREAMRDKRLYR